MRSPKSFSFPRVTLGGVALCLALVTVGCSTGAVNATNSPPSAPSPSASLTFCNTAASGCQPSNSFSLADLRDLQITVNWSNVPAGPHGQKIRFLLPSNDLYQSMSSGFEAPDSAAGSPAVTSTLPVTGTYITRFKLTGNWQVEVSLDNQVIAVQTLQLTP